MLKLATHDSATGEKGYGLLSYLVLPFARTQSKTIKEQLEIGVTSFDIRVRNTSRGLVAAHGLWESKKTIEEILSEINTYKGCYVSLTYEGTVIDEGDFIEDMEKLIKMYPNIKCSWIAVKKPIWKMVKYNYEEPTETAFKNLDGSTWHTYLPLPWLWKKIYYNNVEFNEEVYKRVDFI